MDPDTKTLLNHALISALLGGGTLAGTKLTKELIQAVKGPPEPDNVIKVNIPKERLQKGAAFDQFLNENPNLANYLTGVKNLALQGAVYPVSFGAGVYGMSKVYNALKKKQLKDELAAAEQDYLTTLDKVKQKTAEVLNTSTPKTDELIVSFLKQKVAETAANQSHLDLQLKGLGDLLSSGTKEAAKGLGSGLARFGEGLLPDLPSKDEAANAVGNAIDTLKQQVGNSPLAQLPAAALLLTALGSTGMTYHLLNKANKRKEEEKKQTLPKEVFINPI